MAVYAHLAEEGADYSIIMAPFDVIPRVGEVIEFEFAAYDEEKWDPESWDEVKGINGHEWIVLSVNHRIRRNSISNWGSHIIELIVKRVHE